MRRPSSRLTRLLALAALVTAVTLADARAGAAKADGFTTWLLGQLWSWANGGDSEAARKQAEAAVRQAETALRRQGGSRLLLRIDTDALLQATLIDLRDDMRRQLREERIAFAGLAVRDGSVEVRIREPKDRERARTRFASLAVSAASGEGTVAIADSGEGSLSLRPTEAAFADRVGKARRQSIEVIERRLDGAGMSARAVRPDGVDGIRVLLPGIGDPERLSGILNRRARITFRLVDVSMTAEEALRGSPPPGSEIVYALNARIPLLLRNQVLLDGDDIADAAPGFDQRTNEPIVHFSFNANGARRFGQITQENVGRPFAIVLDHDVISAPIVREPILGGKGQISGNFTVEDANDIAVLLRSGALPGRLTIVEQQVVQPEGHAAAQ